MTLSTIFFDNIIGLVLNFRHIVGMPIPSCVPLVADLLLFCYERCFVLSLPCKNRADVVEAFNSTSRYPDDLLNIDNPYFG